MEPISWFYQPRGPVMLRPIFALTFPSTGDVSIDALILDSRIELALAELAARVNRSRDEPFTRWDDAGRPRDVNGSMGAP